ncbi:DUF1007 family protein, partial [Morganella morganii]
MNTLLLSFLVLLMFSPQTVAHPHSFIDMETTLITENQTLTGIEYVWKMDPMTSADILYDLMNTKE